MRSEEYSRQNGLQNGSSPVTKRQCCHTGPNTNFNPGCARLYKTYEIRCELYLTRLTVYSYEKPVTIVRAALS
jgi:hypothetical protein